MSDLGKWKRIIDEHMSTQPSPAVSRSGEQEAREWWESIGSPVLNEQHLAAYAAHIRTLERERAAKIAESLYTKVNGIGIAAAIRDTVYAQKK